MAGIDKTYISSYDDMVEIGEWLKTLPHRITDDYGNVFSIRPYLGDEMYCAMVSGRNACERYVKEHCTIQDDGSWCCVLWNTSCLFDVWLIRHCPVTAIQNRLSEQYSEEYIQSVRDKQCCYDLYKRPEPAKRFTITKRPDFNIVCNTWWVEISDNEDRRCGEYYEKADYWRLPNEPFESDDAWVSNVAIIPGKMTQKKIRNLVRRWGLPENYTLRILGDYVGQEWIVKTKK